MNNTVDRSVRYTTMEVSEGFSDAALQLHLELDLDLDLGLDFGLGWSQDEGRGDPRVHWIQLSTFMAVQAEHRVLPAPLEAVGHQ